jgi:hypothetical protein
MLHNASTPWTLDFGSKGSCQIGGNVLKNAVQHRTAQHKAHSTAIQAERSSPRAASCIPV